MVPCNQYPCCGVRHNCYSTVTALLYSSIEIHEEGSLHGYISKLRTNDKITDYNYNQYLQLIKYYV